MSLVPATWYLGAWWGQLDAVYVALCLWTGILAIHDRRWLFAVVLGLAMMTKPQAWFVAAPFAGHAIARWGMRRAAIVGLVAVAVALATWLPFVAYGGVADYLRNLDSYQIDQYPIMSVRAGNPWWIVQVAFGGDRFVPIDAGARSVHAPRLWVCRNGTPARSSSSSPFLRQATAESSTASRPRRSWRSA